MARPFIRADYPTRDGSSWSRRHRFATAQSLCTTSACAADQGRPTLKDSLCCILSHAHARGHMSSVAEGWFGSRFEELHPLLQDLHRNPSTLVGEVEVTFGAGIVGIVGKRLASQLGVPTTPGQHSFEVSIYSEGRALHWVRSFNGQTHFCSEFEPVGHYPGGYWVERSGRLTLLLGVQVISGGWHWVHRSTKLFGIPLPKAFLPTTLASKSIEQGLYRFSVEVSAPVLGKLLGYSGRLAKPLAAKRRRHVS